MTTSNLIAQLLQNSEEIKIRNLNDLNLTIKDLSDSVKIVTEWFRQQPHLPDIVPDARMVTHTYIGCKGSIERTKSSLDMYYTMKTLVPQYFQNNDALSPGIRDSNKNVKIIFCPILTKERRRIICYKMLGTENFNAVDGLKYTYLIYMLKVLYDHGCDITMIFDLSDIKMAHVVQLTPFLLKITFKFCKEALVTRIKEIHVMNPPFYANPVIDLAKTFLSAKLQSRVYIHKTFEDLHNVIEKSLLPKDFGGYLRTLQEMHDDWYKVIVEHRDWFLEEEKHTTNESKRPGRSEINELLGIHGSFRKLDVD